MFCSSLFSFVYLAPLLSFCSFFFLSQFWRTFQLNLYFTILIISPPFRSVLFCFPFCALWRPFLHLCYCLFTPVYSHFLYFITFYAPIFCSSLFSFVYLAPRLSFTSFFLFSILTPLFAYLIFYHSYYLTALPFCIILLSFLCFVAPIPSPLLLFVYAFIFPFLPFWRFWTFSYSFFLLNLFPFVTFFYFSFPFLPFYVPFSLFRLLFLSLFFFFPLSPSLFFFFPLPLFPLLFSFFFLTPLLVTFWRPLVATRGASARYAPPKIRHCKWNVWEIQKWH